MKEIKQTFSEKNRHGRRVDAALKRLSPQREKEFKSRESEFQDTQKKLKTKI